MTSPSREHLLGYLLEALDPEEQERVEAELAGDPALESELQKLQSLVGRMGLRQSPDSYDPPPGLAHRTCRYVAEMADSPAITPASLVNPPHLLRERRYSWSDWITLAAVLIAGLSLAFPALSLSRFQSQIASCQNQLRLIGLGLHGYSELDPEHTFPGPELDGPRSTAGIVAPTLVSHKLADPQMFLCPAAIRSRTELPRVIALEELDRLEGLELRAAQRTMGGDYGYSMGYVSDGRLLRSRDTRRPNFALIGDAPSDSQLKRISANHGGRGQNVLFEDGHIQFLRQRVAPLLLDDFYHNHEGWVAAGVEPDDAVLGAGADKPLPPGYIETSH